MEMWKSIFATEQGLGKCLVGDMDYASLAGKIVSVIKRQPN